MLDIIQFAQMKMEKKPIIPSSKRTTWTTTMDRYFIQLMVDQVHDGQYLDGQFSKHAWRIVGDEFKSKFGSEFTSEIMKNHYRAIKKSHSAIKTLLEESGFGWDADKEMVYADDDSVWDAYVKAHPDFKIWRTKSMAGYDQLCIIFGDGGATGKFSRAPEDKDLFEAPLFCNDEPDYGTQEPINLDEEPEGINSKKRIRSTIPPPNSEKCKKPRKTTGEGMVDAIHGMASTFTQMANSKKVDPLLVPPTTPTTSLTLEGRLVAALEAIPDIASSTYMLASDFLEEEKKTKMFVELPLERRKDWLLHKLKEE